MGWTPRIIVLGLMLVVLGVPLALRPSDSTQDSGEAGGDVLVIITPHNEQIRYEFARAFNAYRQRVGKGPVRFDWRSAGGTSDLRRQVLSELSNAIRKDREDARLSYDLFFGGGDYDHGRLASGVTVTFTDLDDRGEQREVSIQLSASVRPGIPDELLKDVFPEQTIGGMPLYHPNRNWIGVALSNFGIVYNRDNLKALGVDEPRTWSDLANPAYVKAIALADPAHSGSIAQTYNVILQRQGWTEGWATLRRVFANARYFTATSSQVPVDVSNGEAAAGMCIDFYGRYQAGAIGGQRVGYIDPFKVDASGKAVGMSAVTADPISLLRGAPNRETAVEFVLWLLSREAQHLWQMRKQSATDAGETAGVSGEAVVRPEKFELRRLPIRRDVYGTEAAKGWADAGVNPFELARPIRPGTPNYFRYVAPLSHAMAIDVHDDLQAAWQTIQATPTDHPQRAEMLKLFDAMPEPLTLRWPDQAMADQWQAILGDPSHARHDDAAANLKAFTGSIKQRWSDEDTMLADRIRWTQFFRKNYRKIVAMGRTD